MTQKFTLTLKARGKAIPWNLKDIEGMTTVSRRDVTLARRLYRENALPGYQDLIDAGDVEDAGELFVPADATWDGGGVEA